MCSAEVSGSRSVGQTGQVAIVTGGGRGLGPLFAQGLAAAGAAVAVAARSAPEAVWPPEVEPSNVPYHNAGNC
jgi:NAD(P)-dependent dehydrogenase (short-subunit alcohol dehydrogenase family)